MKKISDFNSATEKYPVVYAGSATRPEYVDMPTILQQQEGVAPLDTCPAQWWNAMWKLATKDINAFKDYVGDAFTEINNLLVKFNITLDNADSEQLYDFFHDDYVQNYLSTIFVNKSGDTIDGDLHIKGDLTVDGIGEEVISTELKVGANTITLRNENPSALGNTELAGVVTENYDGNNHNNIIAIDKNGVARTGDIDIATRILYSNDGTNFYTDASLTTPAVIGATEEVRDTGNQTSGGVEIYEGITYSNDDTQAIATREDNPVNGALMKWDAATKKLVSAGYDTSDYSELWANNQNRPLKEVLYALGDTVENPTAQQIASALRTRGNNSNFKGLAIGDYFDLPSLAISSTGGSGSITWNESYQNLRFVIAGFNTYNGVGDTDSGTGILMIAKNVVFTSRMNSSDSNDGGMSNMELRKSGGALPRVETAMESALGLTLKTVHRLLRNQTNSTPSWEWLGEKCFLPTETEVFGAQGFGNGVWYTGTGCQYPLFAIAPQARIAYNNGSRAWWWEATPSSYASSDFCTCHIYGNTYHPFCSSPDGGVRFAFYL